jgi:hypothetical protein
MTAMWEAILTGDLLKSIPIQDGHQKVCRVVARHLNTGRVKPKANGERLDDMLNFSVWAIPANPHDQRPRLKEVNSVPNLIGEWQVAHINAWTSRQVEVCH